MERWKHLNGNGRGVISPMGSRPGSWLTGWSVFSAAFARGFGREQGDNGRLHSRLITLAPVIFSTATTEAPLQVFRGPTRRSLHPEHCYIALCSISPHGEMSLHSQLNWPPFQTPLTIVRCMFSQVRHLRAKCRSLSPLNIPTMIK